MLILHTRATTKFINNNITKRTVKMKRRLLNRTIFLFLLLFSGIIFSSCSGEKEKPRHETVILDNAAFDGDSCEYRVTGGEGKIGYLRVIYVARTYDDFIFTVFVPDSFHSFPGQKVKLNFYRCFVSDTHGGNLIPQISEVVK